VSEVACAPGDSAMPAHAERERSPPLLCFGVMLCSRQNPAPGARASFLEACCAATATNAMRSCVRRRSPGCVFAPCSRKTRRAAAGALHGVRAAGPQQSDERKSGAFW